MKRFDFFNKQDVTMENMNDSVLLINEHFQELLKGLIGPGFFERINLSQYYGKEVIRPVFTQGSFGIDYINISLPSENTQIILGVDKNLNPIILDKNLNYQQTDTQSPGGNINIPININQDPQPYTRYIWIIYRECTQPTPIENDYDGVPHLPIKYNGYYILVSEQNPSIYTPDSALYVGQVGVIEGTQIYSYGASFSPLYEGQLLGGVVETNVIIYPDITKRTTGYDASGGFVSTRQKSLKDHINAFGTNSEINANNPHGISPNDMDDVDTNNIKNNCITSEKLSAYNDNYHNTPAVTEANISNYNVTREKVSSYGDGVTNTPAISTNNIENNCITSEKLSFEVSLKLVPIGTVIMWAGLETTVPSQWMVCDGRILLRNNYPSLFNAIGHTWGTDGFDGALYFRLPDLRGQFIRGASNTTSGAPPFGMDPETNRFNHAGQQVAPGVGTYQDYSIKNHRHEIWKSWSSNDSHTHQSVADRFAEGIKDGQNNVLHRTEWVMGDDNVKMGVESRGKNASLFFIIKVL
jgi:microcystin-dependent protein